MKRCEKHVIANIIANGRDKVLYIFLVVLSRIKLAANVKGLPMYRKSVIRLFGKLDEVE